MRFTLERLVELWTFGVPAALCAWAVLRLLPHARARYVFAAIAFVAIPMLPVLQRRSVAPITTIAPPPAAIEVTPILWLSGALLLFARELAGHLRLRRVRRAWSEAPREWRDALDWPAHVQLMMGSDSPVTIGLVRPCVALPRDVFATFDHATVRRIAAHELAHARWRDPLVYALLRVIAATFWPSPLWLVLRWVRREREAAADAAALRDAGGEKETYVAALLRLSRPRLLGVGMAQGDLAYRARRILAPRSSRVLALFALALGIGLATFAAPVDFATRTVFERAVLRAAPQPIARAVVEQQRVRARRRKEPPPVVTMELPLQISRGLDSLGVAPGIAEPQPVVVIDRGPAVYEHVDVDRHVARAVHRADRDDQVIRIVIKDRQ